MAEGEPDRALRTCAVLFGVLALSNLLKPLQLGAETGFVFFGTRLGGTANAILGPLFGLYLAVYAVGIWRLRPWAVPMGVAYALYVVANLVLFTMKNTPPSTGAMVFGVVYMLVAVGVSWGTVYLLRRRLAR